VFRTFSLFFPIVALVCGQGLFAADKLDGHILAALKRSGKNRPQIEAALQGVPVAEREGMRFLIAYMPDRDLQRLESGFLIENIRSSYRAWNESPWKKQVQKELFLNCVVPYANVTERRDNWRKDFRKRFLPVVKDAKTPAVAAALLNRKIFSMLKVRYSRTRLRADQGAYESIKTGTASCTGLSVLLINACRAVGVPARFAGTPLWADSSGNHSWVEVWDDGWHFTGAAEPTGDTLDRGWFAGRAAKAVEDSRLNAIYAVSYKRTAITFPMVWDQQADYVFAVNVTSRYTRSTGKPAKKTKDTGDQASQTAVESLKAFLAAAPGQRPVLGKEPFAMIPLTRSDAARAEELLSQDRLSHIRKTRAAEMKARQLTVGKLSMPFYYKVFGDKPKNGRSMYISMHGGGGAPKRVNDGQWENQKRLYRLKEGVYVVPRAPTNTWNLWHQGHIDSFFSRLIENFIAFEGVNPDRVYLMGYSAGGDGVYQLAPRMADRWAAAAMMAGHPNETSPLGLRNLPFTIHVGGRDAAYNRNKIAAQWKEKLAELHKADPDGYVHWAKLYADKGHWLDREDAAAIPWMAKHQRHPFPKKIVWKQDDVGHTRFYWLAIAKEDYHGRAVVIAERKGQQIDIQVTGVDQLTIRLNDRMLDLDKPMTIRSQGKMLFEGRARRTIAVLATTLDERSDPRSLFSAEVTVDFR
jgi:hypothetical protein